MEYEIPPAPPKKTRGPDISEKMKRAIAYVDEGWSVADSAIENGVTRQAIYNQLNKRKSS